MPQDEVYQLVEIDCMYMNNSPKVIIDSITIDNKSEVIIDGIKITKMYSVPSSACT